MSEVWWFGEGVAGGLPVEGDVSALESTPVSVEAVELPFMGMDGWNYG